MNRSITDDPEKLRQLYWGEGLSLGDIADRGRCCKKTVHNRFEEYNIETRTSTVDKPAPFKHTATETAGGAYEIWRTYVDGTHHCVRVHRLVAVAEHGFDVVADSVVHHKNSIPWDNRPSNLDVMTHEEHAANHAQERLDKHGVAVVGGGSCDA
jgi:hypothetical protein